MTSASVRRSAVVAVLSAGLLAVPFGATASAAPAESAGDCLSVSGSDFAPVTRTVDCSDPTANYRVLRVISHGLFGDAGTCDQVPGETASLTRTVNGAPTEDLCLGGV